MSRDRSVYAIPEGDLSTSRSQANMMNQSSSKKAKNTNSDNSRESSVVRVRSSASSSHSYTYKVLKDSNIDNTNRSSSNAFPKQSPLNIGSNRSIV